jgi:hypothetical protein
MSSNPIQPPGQSVPVQQVPVQQVPVQQVPVQQVPVQQVPMQPTHVHPPPAQQAAEPLGQRMEVNVYSHSPLFYWWPVWFVGFIMAFLTYTQGQTVQFQDIEVRIHPSRTLGVLYTMTFLLVILITHLAVRGVASLTVLMTLIAVTLFFAWMGWWDDTFKLLGSLAIYMNLGFYVFFSSAVFITWALTTFVFDRMEVYKFHPGQMVHENILGTGERTYDARGMVVEKLRSDLFRHWILGLGSGDLHVATTGARKEEFVIPNVLFVGAKLNRIQQLASMRPDDFTEVPGGTVLPG